MQPEFKQQLCEHRNQLRQFKEQERAIRDFLLLCTPQSTIAYHAGAAAEILKWQTNGQFESQGRVYPFRQALLQTALVKMWQEPAFVPESSSNPERPLRYLKKIMVRLLEHQAQQQRTSGVQTVHPAQTSSESSASFAQVWCKHAADDLRKVSGLDVRHIIQRVEEVQAQPEKFHTDLPVAIEEMLLLEAREALGEIGLQRLRQEVEAWFENHRQKWTQQTFDNTVEEALRERLRERFRLPCLNI